MIHWLVKRADATDVPDSLDGVLHPQERAKLATLKTDKRRRDWLLGRLTAKQLICAVVRQHDGLEIAPSTIEVHNGAKGDPVINGPLSMVNGQWATDDLQKLLTLSISHAHGHAFCAVVERPFWGIGADIEWIERRADAFVDDYFTAAERGWLMEATDEMRDVLVTAVWSAKEAVLKAFHLGLTVDTRGVDCLIEPVTERPLTWTPFTIVCHQGGWPCPIFPLTGWWRTWDNFVLTLVVQEES